MNKRRRALHKLLPNVLIASLVVASAATATPAMKTLKLQDAPAPVQQAVRQAPALAGMNIDALEVEERDLNHDGRGEWLVVANATDGSGLHPVNRPLWLFQREGQGWRLLDYLGPQLKVEALPRGGAPAGVWDDLRVLAKDGVRQRCTVLTWDKDHYRQTRCCDARTGAAAPCGD